MTDTSKDGSDLSTGSDSPIRGIYVPDEFEDWVDSYKDLTAKVDSETVFVVDSDNPSLPEADDIVDQSELNGEEAVVGIDRHSGNDEKFEIVIVTQSRVRKYRPAGESDVTNIEQDITDLENDISDINQEINNINQVINNLDQEDLVHRDGVDAGRPSDMRGDLDFGDNSATNVDEVDANQVEANEGEFEEGLVIPTDF
jgi:hypothetical protein